MVSFFVCFVSHAFVLHLSVLSHTHLHTHTHTQRWLIIDFMALSLSAANVYGYYKCSSDQKAQFTAMMQRGAEAGTMSMITSSVGASVGAMSGTLMSWIAGSSSSSNSNVV